VDNEKNSIDDGCKVTFQHSDSFFKVSVLLGDNFSHDS